jgi:hypothetical protein
VKVTETICFGSIGLLAFNVDSVFALTFFFSLLLSDALLGARVSPFLWLIWMKMLRFPAASQILAFKHVLLIDSPHFVGPPKEAAHVV